MASAPHPNCERCNQFKLDDVLKALRAANLGDGLSDSEFHARVRHFQRKRLNPETNTGRGHTALYGLQAIQRLTFMCVFMDAGISPERSLRLLHENEGALLQAIESGHNAKLRPATRFQFAIVLEIAIGAIWRKVDSSLPREAA